MVGLPLYSIRLELQNIGEKSKEDYFLRADDAAVCAELERRQQIQLKRTNDGSGKKKGKDRDPNDDDYVDSDMDNDGEHDTEKVTKWQTQHMQLAESRFLADRCSLTALFDD